MLRALIKAGEPIRRPLLDAAPLDLKGELGATIRGGLNRWAKVELLVAYLAQDGPAYQHYMQRLVDRPAGIHITPIIYNISADSGRDCPHYSDGECRPSGRRYGARDKQLRRERDQRRRG